MGAGRQVIGTEVGPLGVVLPTAPQGGPLDGELVRATARQAVAGGAGALWAIDHLFWAGPVLDPFVALAAVARVAPDAALGTAVLQLPLRRPAEVAKAVASLQVVAGRGVVLGVGIGEHEGEYAAAGRAFRGRAAQLERSVAALREHWTAGEARYRQRPVPAPVPVWFAGRTPPAVARAARVGDGWNPMLLSPAQYRRRIVWLDEALEEAGRPARAVQRAVTTWVLVDDDVGRALDVGGAWLGSLLGVAPGALRRRLVAGPAAACAEVLAEHLAAGAEHVVVQVAADDPRPTLDRLLPAVAALSASGR